MHIYYVSKENIVMSYYYLRNAVYMLYLLNSEWYILGKPSSKQSGKMVNTYQAIL